MTKLTKPVTRVVLYADVPFGEKTLIVTLAPEGLRFREKRARRDYVLPWGYAYLRAVTIAVESDRKARQRKRNTKRAPR